MTSSSAEVGIRLSLQGRREAARGLGDVGNAAQNAGRQAQQGSRGFDRMGGSLERVGRTGGKALMGGLAVAAAAGAVVVGKALVGGLNDALKRADLTAGLEASLGLNAKTAARYGKMASKIYAKNWGGSIDEVYQGIEAVTSAIPGMEKASGRAVRRMTTDALALGQIFGLDVQTSVNAVRTLLTSGLAKSGRRAVDMLTVGLQRIPSYMRGEMIEALDEYAVHFQTLGIEGPQAIAMLAAAGDQLGVIGIDKVGDAVKEFTIRATDMSKTSVDAYDLIGLNAEDMSDRIVRGGRSSRQAMQQIVKGLLDIEGPSARANAAIALFGTPVEDLSVRQIPKFLRSLSAGNGALGDFAGAANKAKEAVGSTARAEFDAWKRAADEKMVQYMVDHVIPTITKVGGWLNDDLYPALRAGKKWFTDLAGGSGSLKSAMSDLEPLVQDGRDLWTAYGPLIKRLAEVHMKNLWLRLAMVTKGLRGMAAVAIWLWNNGYQPLITSVLRGFAKMSEVTGRTLQIIGKAPKMGWVGDLGDKLVKSSAGAKRLADNLVKIPERKDIHVVTTYTQVNAPGGGRQSVGRGMPVGDTVSSRVRGRGDIASTLAAHAAAQRATGARVQITNAFVGGGGRGPGSGDHQAGRALDVKGAGAAKYGQYMRDMGGYAAFHGNGRGKHLHVVPPAVGDTRARMVLPKVPDLPDVDLGADEGPALSPREPVVVQLVLDGKVISQAMLSDLESRTARR